MRERSAQRTTVLRLHDEGLSAAEIGRTLGITRSAVCHHLHQEGRRGKQYGYVHAITPWQEAVLLGTMMGDGRLCRGAPHHNAQLKMGHGPKQLAYMLWKKEQLASFFTDTVVPYRHVTKDGYETYEIRSRSHPILSTYQDMFYPHGKKEVSVEVLSRIASHEFMPVVMAVWFMDDGSLRGDSASFAVGGLDVAQYQRVFDWLTEQGWAGSYFKLKSNCYSYTLTSAASLRFAEMVGPYMHEDLMYKLPSNKPRRKMRR